MNRRNFLQMLGLGGVSVAVTTTVEANPIVPLFSGRESQIWMPEHANLTQHHLVLMRPPSAPWKTSDATSHYVWQGGPVTRMIKSRWPIARDRVLAASDENVAIPSVKVLVPEGADLHEAFYKAAMKMRRDFSDQARALLLAEPEYVRPFSQIVTLVDTPIFAGGLETEERGFYLEISYTPHVVRSEDLDLNGWDVYSENGEYPIEVPTDVDFDRLLELDRLVLAEGANPLRFAGMLIEA